MAHECTSSSCTIYEHPDWSNNLKDMCSLLQKVERDLVVPSKEAFSRKYEKGESIAITDGAGGWINLSPEEDSIQNRLNLLFSGKKVLWEITLRSDVLVIPGLDVIPSKLMLLPTQVDGKAGSCLLWITIPKSKMNITELKSEAKILLKGEIGKFNSASVLIGEFHGVIGVHYLKDDKKSEQTKFIIGMQKATIEIVDEQGRAVK